MKKKVLQFLVTINEVNFENLSLEDLEDYETQINAHLDQRSKSQFLDDSDEELLYQHLETIGEYKTIAPVPVGKKLLDFHQMSSF